MFVLRRLSEIVQAWFAHTSPSFRTYSRFEPFEFWQRNALLLLVLSMPFVKSRLFVPCCTPTPTLFNPKKSGLPTVPLELTAPKVICPSPAKRRYPPP